MSRAKGIEFEDGLKAAHRLTFHAGGHPGLSLSPCCRENKGVVVRGALPKGADVGMEGGRPDDCRRLL